jgi:hypothetical protein
MRKRNRLSGSTSILFAVLMGILALQGVALIVRSICHSFAA